MPARLAPYAIFFLLAVAFVGPALLPGRTMLPTNPAKIPPWRGSYPLAAARPSNNLMADALIITLPGRLFNHQMLRRGEIPLWNPYVFSGYPHLALIQNNALYPLSAPFDAIDPLASLAWSALLHFALAGACMYLFLRRLGLDVAAATIGGTAFELNGMFLVRISAPSYVYSGIWVPLLLLGALKIAEERRLRAGWPLVVGTFLSVLGGHPQITSLGLTMAGGLLVLKTWVAAPAGRPREVVRALALGAASIALGVGLASFQVLPFLELMSSSARTSLPLEAYRKAAVPWVGLLQGLLPDAFGNPVDRTYWFTKRIYLIDGLRHHERLWGLNYCGENLFTGLAPLVLAAVAVARSRRGVDTTFWALVAVASIGVFFGSPLLDLAYFTIPGFRHSRPDRIVLVYMTAVAVLAALGFEAIQERRDEADASAEARAARRTHTGRLCALVSLLVVVVLWRATPRFLDPGARGDLLKWLWLAGGRWRELIPHLWLQVALSVAVLVTSILLVRRDATPRLGRRFVIFAWLVLLAVPMLRFGWHFNPAQVTPVFGATALERFAVDTAGGSRVARVLDGSWRFLPANMGQLLGLRDVNGASAAGVETYLALMAAADPASVAKHKYFRFFRNGDLARGPLLDLLDTRLVISNLDLSADYRLAAAHLHITLYENTRALPRFRVVPSWEIANDESDARARVLAADFDHTSRVVLLEKPAFGTEAAPPAVAQPPVIVERDDPHAIRLRATTPTGGVLVAADVFYPGWRAWVDGERADVLQANAAFRGVALPPGEHVVELRFQPLSFRLGVAISLASLLVVAAGAWVTSRRR